MSRCQAAPRKRSATLTHLPCPVVSAPTVIEWCELLSSGVNRALCHATKHKPHPICISFLSNLPSTGRNDANQPTASRLHVMSTNCHQTPFPCQALSTESTILAPNHSIAAGSNPPSPRTGQAATRTLSTRRVLSHILSPGLGRFGNSCKRESYRLILPPAAQPNDVAILGRPYLGSVQNNTCPGIQTN